MEPILVSSEQSYANAHELEAEGVTSDFTDWLEEQPEVETSNLDDPDEIALAVLNNLVVDEKAVVVTPGGRIGDDSSHNFSPRDNWVDKRGGLPKYIKEVRNALVRAGHSEGRATALAVASMKRWARGGNHVTAKVQAAAAEALAHWEVMKATKMDSGELEIKMYDAEHGAPTQTNAHAAKQPDRTPHKAPPPGQKKPPRHNQSGSGPKQNNNPEFNEKHPRDQFGKFAAIQEGDGMHGEDDPEKEQRIKQTQRALVALGLLDEDGVDGAFGPKTQAAIEKWQASQGMKADGLLSKDTIHQLARQGIKKGLDDEEAAKKAAKKKKSSSGGRKKSSGSSGGSSSSNGSSSGGSSSGGSSGSGSGSSGSGSSKGGSGSSGSGKSGKSGSSASRKKTASGSAKLGTGSSGAGKSGSGKTGDARLGVGKKPKTAAATKPKKIAENAKFARVAHNPYPSDKELTDSKGHKQTRTQFNVGEAGREMQNATANLADLKKRGAPSTQIAKAQHRIEAAKKRQASAKAAVLREQVRAKKHAETEARKATAAKVAAKKKADAEAKKKAKAQEAARVKAEREHNASSGARADAERNAKNSIDERLQQLGIKWDGVELRTKATTAFQVSLINRVSQAVEAKDMQTAMAHARVLRNDARANGMRPGAMQAIEMFLNSEGV